MSGLSSFSGGGWEREEGRRVSQMGRDNDDASTFFFLGRNEMNGGTFLSPFFYELPTHVGSPKKSCDAICEQKGEAAVSSALEDTNFSFVPLFLFHPFLKGGITSHPPPLWWKGWNNFFFFHLCCCMFLLPFYTGHPTTEKGRRRGSGRERGSQSAFI